MKVRYINMSNCEAAIIGLVLAYFAFSPRLIDVPLCPSAFFGGAPCPTCGTTRAVWHLLHGDLQEAWTANPLGFLVAFLLARRLTILCIPLGAIRRWLDCEFCNRALLVTYVLLGLCWWMLRLAS